jgi:outer membrane protein TolC
MQGWTMKRLLGRWLHGWLGVVLVCGVSAGCRQQVFLDKQCYELAHSVLPPQVERDFNYGTEPINPITREPATLNQPDRPAWNMTLHEAFALALENGTIGDAAGAGAGALNEQQASFVGSIPGANAQTDRVKALALNPAIGGANLEATLSRYDARLISTLGVNNIDELQQSPFSSPNTQNAVASTSIVKALPTGGVVATSFSTNYRFLPNAAAQQSPAQLYEQRLAIGFEQPLLRNFGVELNQIVNAFPTFGGTGANGTAATDFNARSQAANNLGIANEGILISRIRLDQQRAEFERRVQNMLLNVEVAYWKLYESYGTLYSYEEVLRLAHKAWVQNHAKFLAGTIGPAVYHPIRAQYEEFRGNRIESIGSVLERERILRGLLGLPVEDGKRIVPIDAPTLAPYQPNWDNAVQMAMMQKPELAIVRDNLRTAQYQVVQQKNFLKPDLRFTAQYSPIGFGTRLDGNGTFTGADGLQHTVNANRDLAGDHFNEWSVGLTFAMPLGYRLEQSAMRAARLELAQSYYLLKDQEDRAQRTLALYYQAIATQYNKIEANRAERQAYGLAVEARYREFAVGKSTVSDFLLDAMRRLVAAQLKEYNAIQEYNSDLARYEWAKGNIMKHDNVVIADGNIPVCAEVRAIDHERARAEAIVLRERPHRDPLRTPALLTGSDGIPEHLDMQGAPSSVALPPAEVDINPKSAGPAAAPTAPAPLAPAPLGPAPLPAPPKFTPPTPAPKTLPAIPPAPMTLPESKTLPYGPMSSAGPTDLGNGVTVVSTTNPAYRSMQSGAGAAAVPTTPVPVVDTRVYSSPPTATPPTATPVIAPETAPSSAVYANPYVANPYQAKTLPTTTAVGTSSAVYAPAPSQPLAITSGPSGPSSSSVYMPQTPAPSGASSVYNVPGSR